MPPPALSTTGKLKKNHASAVRQGNDIIPPPAACRLSSHHSDAILAVSLLRFALGPLRSGHAWPGQVWSVHFRGAASHGPTADRKALMAG